MYDTGPYIDPVARVPGFHDAYCRITWSPRDSAALPGATIRGPYLDAESPCGTVYLGCGIESVMDDLGVGELVKYEHLAAVADLVSHQLVEKPRAELRCRQGTALIELVPRGLSG